MICAIAGARPAATARSSIAGFIASTTTSTSFFGVVAGIVCAGIGVAAVQPLLARVRARLDAEAGGMLPVLVEGAAALSAALSVVAPPIGVILVAALVWLLVAGRGRTHQKYAGLRILR